MQVALSLQSMQCHLHSDWAARAERGSGRVGTEFLRRLGACHGQQLPLFPWSSSTYNYLPFSFFLKKQIRFKKPRRGFVFFWLKEGTGLIVSPPLPTPQPRPAGPPETVVSKTSWGFLSILQLPRAPAPPPPSPPGPFQAPPRGGGEEDWPAPLAEEPSLLPEAASPTRRASQTSNPGFLPPGSGIRGTEGGARGCRVCS